VGSIGVISGTSVDMTALFERLGVKVTTFHSGRNKTMLSSNEPLTEEQREIMQSISDEAYDQFVSVVADSRVLPVAAVTELADGRIYTAAQAKNLRLLDDVLFWEDFCTQMKEVCGLGSDGEIREISTVEKDFWHDFWHGAKGFFRQISLSSEERLMEHVMSNNVKFPAYYYGGF
jgi:protease-4